MNQVEKLSPYSQQFFPKDPSQTDEIEDYVMQIVEIVEKEGITYDSTQNLGVIIQNILDSM